MSRNNGSHGKSREGRVFTSTERNSGIIVSITYRESISGPKYDRVESLGMNVAAFLAKLDAVEASDCDRAKVVYIINSLLEDPEEIITDLQETGNFALVTGFEVEDGLTWIASQPPANVDVANN